MSSNSESMLLSENDLNSMGSFIKFAVRRGPASNALQQQLDRDRQLIILHQDTPSPNCSQISTNSINEHQNQQQLQKQQEKNGEEDQKAVEEKENICNIVLVEKPSLDRLKLPAIGENKVVVDDQDQDREVDEDDDGFKTPTSLDQKIPASLPCPPPPRKPKAHPSSIMKRRAPPRRRVLLDLSNEIELLFPPAIRADLGNTIKKIRQEYVAN